MKILIAAKQINLSTVRSLLFNRRLLSSSVAEVKKLPIEHYRKSIDDSDYDTVVLVGNDLQKNLAASPSLLQSSRCFHDLANLKAV